MMTTDVQHEVIIDGGNKGGVDEDWMTQDLEPSWEEDDEEVVSDHLESEDSKPYSEERLANQWIEGTAREIDRY